MRPHRAPAAPLPSCTALARSAARAHGTKGCHLSLLCAQRTTASTGVRYSTYPDTIATKVQQAPAVEMLFKKHFVSFDGTFGARLRVAIPRVDRDVRRGSCLPAPGRDRVKARGTRVQARTRTRGAARRRGSHARRNENRRHGWRAGMTRGGRASRGACGNRGSAYAVTRARARGGA